MAAIDVFFEGAEAEIVPTAEEAGGATVVFKLSRRGECYL